MNIDKKSKKDIEIRRLQTTERLDIYLYSFVLVAQIKHTLEQTYRSAKTFCISFASQI